MAVGLEAQTKLAAVAILSLLVGIYIALVCAMIWLLSRRPVAPPPKRCARKVPADRLLLGGLLVLSMALIGQWTCVVTRAFQAFIVRHDGMDAAAFFVQDVGSEEVAKGAFHSATMVVADLFVYDHAIASTATALLRWKITHSALTISINVYCTALIVWEVGRIQKRSAQYASGASGLRSAPFGLTAFSVVIAAAIAYGLDHVSHLFLTDCIPAAAALAAVLVHVRAVLARRGGGAVLGGGGSIPLGSQSSLALFVGGLAPAPPPVLLADRGVLPRDGRARGRGSCGAELPVSAPRGAVLCEGSLDSGAGDLGYASAGEEGGEQKGGG
ncbi:hypothetical protein HDZ31DRAFT_75514 [Schizophyllum fasciatum]